MRRTVLILAAGLLLAGGAAAALGRDGPAAGERPPGATLTVLTGAVQVLRAGTGTAEVAAAGDRLRAGDRVFTGPATRAILALSDHDQVRLDSGTEVLVASADGSGAELEQDSGRTWSRSLTGASLAVLAHGHRLSAGGRGSEFSVAVNGGRVVAAVYSGALVAGALTVRAGSSLAYGEPGPVEPAPISEAAGADPWAVLNQALDLAPGDPSAIGTGRLLPGEESSVQQAVAVDPAPVEPDLVFTAGWQAGSLELEVIDPAGAVHDRALGRSAPLSLTVHGAAPGNWSYRVLDPDQGDGAGTWFVLVAQTSP